MVRRPDIFPCVFEKQKLAIKLQKSGGQEKNKWKRFKWEKQSFCFLRKIRLNKPISTMYLLVPTPQALHLSLNTDTFSLSGQSPSVLVSCVPLPAGWKLLDARPPSGQTKLWGGLSGCIDLKSLCGADWFCLLPNGNVIEEHWFRRISWQVESTPLPNHLTG